MQKPNKNVKNQLEVSHHPRGTPPELLLAMAHLKDLLIQYPGAEHDDAVDVDDGMLAAVQELGDFLFTVQNQGDVFLLHTQSHSVPPARTQPTDGSGRALAFAEQGNDCIKMNFQGLTFCKPSWESSLGRA